VHHPLISQRTRLCHTLAAGVQPIRMGPTLHEQIQVGVAEFLWTNILTLETGVFFEAQP
jgi:hypothetical protein